MIAAFVIAYTAWTAFGVGAALYYAGQGGLTSSPNTLIVSSMISIAWFVAFVLIFIL